MVLNDRENISQIKIGMNSTASDSVTIQIHVEEFKIATGTHQGSRRYNNIGMVLFKVRSAGEKRIQSYCKTNK